jgi:hypothetical protein
MFSFRRYTGKDTTLIAKGTTVWLLKCYSSGNTKYALIQYFYKGNSSKWGINVVPYSDLSGTIISSSVG